MFFSFFNTKNQKILMRGFSGKWARTYGRTDGGESKGPSTPSRDQKQQARGARSLGKFPKYCNKKNKFFTPKEIFQV